MSKNSDASSGKLLPKKTVPKKRIVSAPRKKKGEAKITVNFRTSPAEVENLDGIAAGLKVSRSHLISKAIDRCIHDGIWRKVAKKSNAGSKSPLPLPEVVALSNVLLEVAFVVESLLKNPENPKYRDHAARILLDAREGLAILRDELGC